MKQVLVRYRVDPARAEENAGRVRDVYEELAQDSPAGFRYATLRLDGGGEFVHIAFNEGEDDPLTSLPAFRRFREGLTALNAEGPHLTEVEVVGSYGF